MEPVDRGDLLKRVQNGMGLPISVDDEKERRC